MTMSFEESLEEANEQAVWRLNHIDASNPDDAHSEADKVLLDLVNPTVEAAYLSLRDRCDWWATA